VIALIDYGAGNLASVRKALTAAGGGHFSPASAEGVRDASAMVIPGVGHFSATAAISPAWRRAILDAVDRGVPLLGICLGMQYLFDGSDEAPEQQGLGLLRGQCIRLPSSVKVPHVGWNDLKTHRASRLLDGGGGQAYFTHSYAVPVTADTVAATEHGIAFAAAVERGNVFGVQFHPEKSSVLGLAILRAFVAISEGRATTARSDHPPCSPSA
jgi:glutamine amidotransferase